MFFFLTKLIKNFKLKISSIFNKNTYINFFYNLPNNLKLLGKLIVNINNNILKFFFKLLKLNFLFFLPLLTVILILISIFIYVDFYIIKYTPIDALINHISNNKPSRAWGWGSIFSEEECELILNNNIEKFSKIDKWYIKYTNQKEKIINYRNLRIKLKDFKYNPTLKIIIFKIISIIIIIIIITLSIKFKFINKLLYFIIYIIKYIILKSINVLLYFTKFIFKNIIINMIYLLKFNKSSIFNESYKIKLIDNCLYKKKSKENIQVN